MGSATIFSILVVLGLLTVMLIRTVTFPSHQPDVGECSPDDVDFVALTEEMIGRFQSALRIKTVSWTPTQVSLPETLEFHKFLEKAFPLIHSSRLVQRETVHTHSLLYRVQGSNPSLKPYLLMAHMDVVPVDQQTWEVPPFEARIVDGFLYGRGAMDNKNSLMGIMEALEFRLKKGLPPVRAFYMAFGHDEEVNGRQGAKFISDVFAERKLQFEFILDEGTTILMDSFRGVDAPVAIIGVAEKGAVYVNLTVDSIPTGHSSMPPKESNIGVLAKALARIEENPLPSMFGTGPEKGLLEAVATEAEFPLKFVITNLWFFRPIVSWIMSMKPQTNALVRTTTAVTMVGGGTKTNVIPPSAWGIVNHRIHPSQTVEEVVEYDRQLIQDERVTITILEDAVIFPSPLSPYEDDTFGYMSIARSVKQVFPSAVVAPGIMIANTDSRFYWDFSKQIYRFCPTVMYPTDMARFHGLNERISLDNLQQTVNFFYHVTANADRERIEPKHAHSGEL